MADAPPLKRKTGRPALSESERKRRRLQRNTGQHQFRVFLGSEKRRWDELKAEKGFQTDREVATFLIDRFVGF